MDVPSWGRGSNRGPHFCHSRCYCFLPTAYCLLLLATNSRSADRRQVFPTAAAAQPAAVPVAAAAASSAATPPAAARAVRRDRPAAAWPLSAGQASEGCRPAREPWLSAPPCRRPLPPLQSLSSESGL